MTSQNSQYGNRRHWTDKKKKNQDFTLDLYLKHKGLRKSKASLFFLFSFFVGIWVI